MKINFSKIVGTAMDNVVGQDIAKERLANNIVGGYLQDGYTAPTGVFAATGFGKTHLLKAAKAIYKGIWGDERKVIWAPSGDELGGPVSFWEDILLPHVADKKVMFIIDEFHKAARGVQDIIRSMIEITTDRSSKVVKKNDYELLVDPHKHAFIIGTNRVDEIDDALLSRLDRIDLGILTDDNMEQILFRALEKLGYVFHENTLRKIAQCNRGNARDVVKWVDAIRLYLAMAGKNSINKKDAAAIIRSRATFPLGVTQNELNTLVLLEKYGEQQLKELATKNGVASSEQNANERYLMARALMTIDGKRMLTKEGRDYLSTLRDEGFIPDAVPSVNNLQVA